MKYCKNCLNQRTNGYCSVKQKRIRCAIQAYFCKRYKPYWLKYGKWQFAGFVQVGDYDYVVQRCSNCGHKQLDLTDYCPECHAKMGE